MALQFVLLFAFTLSTQLPHTPARASGDAQTPQLQLRVRTDRRTYSIKGKMQMEVQLTNVGMETVYLWRWDLCWGQGPTLNLWVEDSDGHEVHTDVLWDCVPPPPKPEGLSDFIRIDPSNFYGLRDEINLREIVNKPGKYKLSIEFTGFLSPEDLANMGFPKLPYWRPPEKPLTADVYITVTP
jgi:hypothetical protein